ncbi:hypothetical protein MJO28_007934 [Puccinia striiformis f. sp. tritici]|uniref:Uncharacterized protein n=1 Tax=Puccinia striiformis f. sp. tritici TaxID=168172 RepID=A0ACC0EAD5_9BASI|nr:hypothetical protein MJO28_007934 [Puccinia striiformis f. sp. tritici]
MSTREGLAATPSKAKMRMWKQSQTNGIREDSVIFYDQGIPLHVFTALNKLRLVNTKASVNFKTSISTERGATLTDWDTVFNSCPWKFNTFQKEFIHAWFDAN